jgi:hypothetical protein
MSETHVDLPAIVPTLSRGKHRHPRKGACFMEFASYLAGEPWSDHPECTHPLLAEAARLVNDNTSDTSRNQLAELIPDVIGLNSASIRVDARISLACARVALPVASADRQRVLAVAMLAAERVLADRDGRQPGSLEPASVAALAEAPQAKAWAQDFIKTLGFSPRGFRRHAAPKAVRCAVIGTAQACIRNQDELLRTMLTDAIRDCRRAIDEEQAAPARSLDRVNGLR